MIFIYFVPYPIGCKRIERGLSLYTVSTSGDDTSHCGNVQGKHEECVCLCVRHKLSQLQAAPSISHPHKQHPANTSKKIVSTGISQGQIEDTHRRQGLVSTTWTDTIEGKSINCTKAITNFPKTYC